MTDTTSNDRAFIKISEELIRRRNDIEALNAILLINNYMNESARNQAKRNAESIREDALHTEEFSGISRTITLLGDQHKIRAEIDKAQKRLNQLSSLAEAYINGQDIVQKRLSQD